MKIEYIILCIGICLIAIGYKYWIIRIIGIAITTYIITDNVVTRTIGGKPR